MAADVPNPQLCHGDIRVFLLISEAPYKSLVQRLHPNKKAARP